MSRGPRSVPNGATFVFGHGSAHASRRSRDAIAFAEPMGVLSNLITPHRRRSSGLVLVALAALSLLGGCGGGSRKSATTSEATTGPQAVAIATKPQVASSSTALANSNLPKRRLPKHSPASSATVVSAKRSGRQPTQQQVALKRQITARCEDASGKSTAQPRPANQPLRVATGSAKQKAVSPAPVSHLSPAEKWAIVQHDNAAAQRFRQCLVQAG